MTVTTTTAMPWVALGGAFSILALLAIPVGLLLVIEGIIQFFRPPGPRPEEILKARYASGEISQAQFEEMLRTVRGESL